MSNSRRWRLFVTWWNDYVKSQEGCVHICDLEKRIDDKIEEIKRGECHAKNPPNPLIIGVEK